METACRRLEVVAAHFGGASRKGDVDASPAANEHAARYPPMEFLLLQLREENNCVALVTLNRPKYLNALCGGVRPFVFVSLSHTLCVFVCACVCMYVCVCVVIQA